jgi:aminoglycoside phosphotransferase (APT) family kinase protein
MSETPDRPIASGNVAEVFAHGSRILKLYKQVEGKAAAFREAALHAAVEAMGLPGPALWGVERVGDRWGVIFDRIEGSSFADRIRNAPEAAPGYLDLLVRLQLDIHSQPGVAFPNLKRRLAAKIARAPNISEARRRSLLAKQADLADGDRLCHGDFHPLNVLGDAATPMIIDWPDATCGDPAADCCRSYLILKLHAQDLAEPYLDAHRRLGSASRDRILAWLPSIAAARLAEEVCGEAGRLLAIVG